MIVRYCPGSTPYAYAAELVDKLAKAMMEMDEKIRGKEIKAHFGDCPKDCPHFQERENVVSGTK